MLRLDFGFRERRNQRILFPPCANLFPPGAKPRPIHGPRIHLAQHGVQLLQHTFHITDDRQISMTILRDFRRIDVNVNHLSMRRERLQPSRNTVVKTNAQGDDQIGVIHAHVGGIGPVHTRHGNVVWMIARQCADAHQSANGRRVDQFNQFLQLSASFGMNHAAAGINHRALRFQHHLRGAPDLASVPFRINLVSRQVDGANRRVSHVALENIFSDVYQHRTRPARRGNVERLMNRLRQIGNILDQEIMLGSRTRDAECIGFLECVGANQSAGHLTGKRNDRDRIQQRIDQAGSKVGGAGARRGTAYAGFAGSPNVALRGEGGILFMPHQYVPDRVIEQGVIKRDGNSTRIPINGVDAFAHQAFKQDF